MLVIVIKQKCFASLIRYALWLREKKMKVKKNKGRGGRKEDKPTLVGSAGGLP